MKRIFLYAVIASLVSACQSNQTSESANVPAGVHTAVVQEVLQTSQYTYLHVKEANAEPWLAVQKMQAKVGDTYYYRDGLPMTDFVSKELNRTFPEVLFLDNISATPDIPVRATQAASADSMNMAPEAMNNNANPGLSDARTIIAKEVLQTNQYTYIRAKEGENEIWIAVSKMEAAVGKTYFFKGGLPMTDFKSKELNRTFKEILFVDNLSSNDAAKDNTGAVTTQTGQAVSTGSAVPMEKKDVKLKHAKGEMSIASLYENKKTYAGKTVKIKGEVMKFTPGVMKKNWIHLQDGTDYKGKFDLVATTDQEVKVGDIITVEGMINLDKDFGYNYFYDVLMEDAKVTK